jgi:hypothetical protein
MKEKRFEVIYSEGQLNGIRILLDKETGVEYLETYNGYSGGLTVLLGRDGKPLLGRTNYDD